MPTKPDHDRRRHKRYRMKNRIFAVVRSDTYESYELESMSKGSVALAVLKSKPPRMGEIVEISQGGLAFHYLANDSAMTHDAEMDILFADEDFHLRRLPVRPVTETEVQGDSPFDVLVMRRLTVAFGGLTPRQRAQLAHVLQSYTSKEVSPSPGKPRNPS